MALKVMVNSEPLLTLNDTYYLGGLVFAICEELASAFGAVGPVEPGAVTGILGGLGIPTEYVPGPGCGAPIPGCCDGGSCGG